MTWRVETRPAGDTLPVLHVIACHDVWRRLTSPSRDALVRLADDPDAAVHPRTLVALTRHGLTTPDGAVTPAGRQVVKYRPTNEQEAPVDEPTMSSTGERARRLTYLSPPDFHRLDWACEPIREAFGGPPYLVGSVLTRPDFRDIDVRLILDDDLVKRMFGDDDFDGTVVHPNPHAVRLLLNIALSDLIAKLAGLPWQVDFQIQSMSEANIPDHNGYRVPLGMRAARSVSRA